jgi:CheY-like chemotaxis protein
MSQQKLVLIIEDATEIADIFAEILQLQGMLTEVVNDGAVALRRIQEKTPALILLDMHLPSVSGLEILSELQANPRLSSIRVIAVTADALLAASLEDKVDLVLVKPVTFGQISDLSKWILEHK